MKKILLLVTMIGLSNISIGQVALTEDFEGTTFPPTGWTVVNTNPTNNWIQVGEADALNGSGSAAVNWIAAAQDESLISPSFSLVGYTSAYFNFTAAVGYQYMVTIPNGNLFAKVSTDGGLNWTQLWVEEDEGVFGNQVPLNIHLNMNAYVGMSNVKIKFQYVANDADLVTIDDVSVTACPGIGNVGLTALTDTTATTTWDGTSTGYALEWGPVGFTQGTGTTVNITSATYDFTGLTAGTGYSYYIRSNCGGTVNGAWQGPYTFYTTLSTSTDLDYAYGFETPTLGSAGWSAPNPAAGQPWQQFNATGALVQDGASMAGAFGSGVVSNSWIFSRGLNLQASIPVTISYYIREFKAAGNGGTNNLTVKIGTSPTAVAQTSLIATHTNVGAALAVNDVYVQQTYTYTPTVTGVYYLGFNYTSPIQTTTNNGAILLDAVSFSLPLSTGEFLINKFEVAPNPANDFISIINKDNNSVTGLTITDLNGRVVKQSKYNNVISDVQVNVSALSSGMYLMNIETDKGPVTKKIIKK